MIGGSSNSTLALAVADMNGDGDLDVVEGVSGSMVVYRSAGGADPFNGTIAITISTGPDSTQALDIGDADGDGDLDIVAANLGQTNKLYLNDGTDSMFASATGLDVGTEAEFTFDITFADLEGDGDLDVVVGNTTPNRWYLNNGTRNPFAGSTGQTFGAAGDSTQVLVAEDMNRDGQVDLLLGNGGQTNRLLYNNGPADPFGAVTPDDVGGAGVNTYGAAVGDVDNDGDLDIVIANGDATNSLYYNNGTSTPFDGVTPEAIGTSADDSRAIALGDVNGDGHLDVLVGNSSAEDELYLSNGTASPYAGVTPLKLPASIFSFTRSIALADLDRDGDLDVVTGKYNRANSIYLNDGSNDPFTNSPGRTVGNDGYYTEGIVIADINGDGYPDILSANLTDPHEIHLNNGTADPFYESSTYTLPITDSFAYSIAAGDVDGDGDQDVVLGELGQSIRTNKLFFNDGSGNFPGGAVEIGTEKTGATYRILLHDIDRDGDLDVVAGNDGQGYRPLSKRWQFRSLCGKFPHCH